MTTKFAGVLIIAALVGAAFVEMKLRNPPCKRCGARAWMKSIWKDWACGRCGAVVNPLNGEIQVLGD